MFVERFSAWAASASVDDRTNAVGDVVSTYLAPETSDRDRLVCERIFTLFLDDPSSKVRAELARYLSVCDHAPRALIWNLSNDIAEVSRAVFQHSNALCTRTLLEAIEAGSPPVQRAIAQRETLDVDVVRNIAALADASAILALLENRGVTLGPNLKHDIANRLGEDADVRATLLDDDDLEPRTRQLLALKLTSALGALVGEKGWIKPAHLERVKNDAKNGATLNIARHSAVASLSGYVKHLQTTGQLTAALIMRSICTGNITFFEACVSHLSGASLKRVQSIVDEARLSAFKSLYKKSGLPGDAYPVFLAAIKVWKRFGKAQLEAGSNESMLCEKAINEILTLVENEPAMDRSMLSMLRRLSAEAARESARTVGAPQQPLLTAA